MTNLTRDELEAIESRAELCFSHGDKAALREEDVALLVAEIRELWELKTHLIALNRQGLDRLARDTETDPP